MAGLILFSPFHVDVAGAKRKSVPAVQLELPIVAVELSPQPYTGTGSLTFTVEVELPHDLDDETILGSLLIDQFSFDEFNALLSRSPSDRVCASGPFADGVVTPFDKAANDGGIKLGRHGPV